jgi:hypothetical protein
LGTAAVFSAPVGIAAAFAGLGSFMISQSAQKEIPEKLKSLLRSGFKVGMDHESKLWSMF